MTNQKQAVSRPAGYLPTVWQMRTYDVWGNEEDGYQVNDTYDAGKVELWVPQTRHNVGTPREFVSAAPSLRQLKLAFGVTCRISVDGDDTRVTVERERDSYPLGELECLSHESLSPVRPRPLPEGRSRGRIVSTEDNK